MPDWAWVVIVIAIVFLVLVIIAIYTCFLINAPTLEEVPTPSPDTIKKNKLDSRVVMQPIPMNNLLSNLKTTPPAGPSIPSYSYPGPQYYSNYPQPLSATQPSQQIIPVPRAPRTDESWC
jgi:hypothetical protein